MALRGNLRDFTITQLLNLINLASKTGTLILDGPSEQAYVSFREGNLLMRALARRMAVLHRFCIRLIKSMLISIVPLPTARAR